MQPRITIIGGAYGSGKTEFAIAYALQQAQDISRKVALIDLDIVNPYFRSRDIAAELADQGLSVISTEPGYEHSDLPALSPRIYGVLQNKDYQVVFDVGGDPAGARALGRFHQYFEGEKYHFYIVVNPYRPDTRNVPDTLKLINEISSAGRLQANGIISNINLGGDTTIAIWKEGLPLVEKLAAQSNLPIVGQMVEQRFWVANQDFFTGFPVFPITLHMVTPWLKE